MALLGDISKVGKSALGVLNPSGLFNTSFAGVHFQRNYMWEIVLPTFMVGGGGTISIGGYSASNPGFIPMPGILLSKMCQKISFGDYNLNSTSDSTRFGAFEAKYPGMMVIDPIKLTFLKTVPDLVTTYFTQWRKLMISSSGLYSPKSQYAKMMYLLFLDTTGVPVNRYKFSGVFPTSMPKYNLDFNSNTVTSVDIDLNVDSIDTMY